MPWSYKQGSEGRLCPVIPSSHRGGYEWGPGQAIPMSDRGISGRRLSLAIIVLTEKVLKEGLVPLSLGQIEKLLNGGYVMLYLGKRENVLKELLVLLSLGQIKKVLMEGTSDYPLDRYGIF